MNMKMKYESENLDPHDTYIPQPSRKTLGADLMPNVPSGYLEKSCAARKVSKMFKVKPKPSTSFVFLYSARWFSKSWANQQFLHESTRSLFSLPPLPLLFARMSNFGDSF